jgi:wobble nucleotide-excising tRNase
LALIVAELKRLEIGLKQLGQAIQERQNRLDAVEQDLSLVRMIREYLQLEERKQVLETIQESDAFKQLETIRDRIAQLVEDAEAIKNAVAEVAREEAETRLAVASETIDEYFRQLSRRPAVQQLKLAVTADKRTRRNNYDITDQNGKDLTPTLSQGDLNALALAIFLGLAATAKESSTFGFLMLDDPSQSLGSEHKKHLAQLLGEVAQHKRVIVATMDTEFHECLKEGFTKAKKEYRFGN